MEGKVCTKCKQWKPLEEFNKNKNHKDGRQYECRECTKKYNKQWRGNNPEYQKQWKENNPGYYNSEQRKQYREVNKEKKKEYDKQYRKDNAERIKERNKQYYKQYYKDNAEHYKQYYKDNAERIKGRHKQHYKDNVEYYKQYYKQYRKDNAEYLKRYSKQYYKDNIEEIKEYDKQRRENEKENNLQYVSGIVNQVRPIFRELNLPVYGYIYKFENVKTGHVYIGQTILPLKVRYGSNAIKSWIKDRKHYQNQKFKDELIEEDIIATELFDVGCCKYHLDKLEAYWINYYDSYNNGYNNNAGHHNTDDGLEEFIEILEQHNLEFIDGQIVKKAN